jgi:hypothetical protein
MLNMSENKPNIGGILGNVLGGLTTTTVPMLTNLIRSALSPEVIKSVSQMVPDLVETLSSVDLRGLIKSALPPEVMKSVIEILLDVGGAVVDTVTSIDLKDLAYPTIRSIVMPALRLLDPLLELLGDLIVVVSNVMPLKILLNKILDALSGAVTVGILAIQGGEVISSAVERILPVAMKLLDPISDILAELIRSVLKPEVVRSVVEVLPRLMNAVVDSISSIGLGELVIPEME